MRNIEHVKEMLGGLAVLIGVLALIGAFAFTGWTNNQKVQEMTRFCVEQGYDGWAGEDWSDSGAGCAE